MSVTAMSIAFILLSVDSTAARTVAVWNNASPWLRDAAAFDRTAVLPSRVTAGRVPSPPGRATATILERRPLLAAAGARLFAEISPPAETASQPSAERSDLSGCEPNDHGVFRDPAEVFGVRFTRSTMNQLCEAESLISPGAIVKTVRHTRRGSRVCSDVCGQFRESVARVDRGDGGPPAKVSTLDAYCCLEGGPRPATLQELLGSRCKCVYRVQSGKNRRIELAEYSFGVNGAGEVRVSVADAGCKRYVAAAQPTAVAQTAAGRCA